MAVFALRRRYGLPAARAHGIRDVEDAVPYTR